MYEYIAITIKGKKRNTNEDRIMIHNHMLSNGTLLETTQDPILAVICDGVGGETGGAIAAEISAKEFQGIKPSRVSPQRVFKTIDSINQEILKEQHKCLHNSMATTIAGITLMNKRFILFNSGDTRIYEITYNHVLKHTKDHIQTVGNKTLLNNYLGGSGTMCSPYVKKGELLSPDSFIVMCSDGIYKQITDLEMHRIIISDAPLRRKAVAILELSSLKGSCDDKSLIILHLQK